MLSLNNANDIELPEVRRDPGLTNQAGVGFTWLPQSELMGHSTRMERGELYCA
jgi:hypothetical protein